MADDCENGVECCPDNPFEYFIPQSVYIAGEGTGEPIEGEGGGENLLGE